MWEFFGSVLEKHGLSAVISLAVLIGLGLQLRALWKKNQLLWVKLCEQAETHEALVAELEGTHATEVRELQEKCAARINELQEKRLAENVATAREAVKFIEQTKTSVELIRVAMETLTDVMTGRR